METLITHFREAVNQRPLNGFQLRMLLLCTVLLITDGFDAQAIAFVAPVLSKEWSSAVGGFGQVFSAGMFGLMLGALSFSLLADRYGHKRVLMLCTLWYSCATLATVMVTSLNELTVLRFITGLGLGGAMPIVIGLVSDSAPDRLRSWLITIAVCGFSLGGALGGFTVAPLIAAFGWKVVFVVGGVSPLLLIPLLGKMLPESLPYLVRTNSTKTRIEYELGRIVPGFKVPVEEVRPSVISTKTAERPLLTELFANGYVTSTLLIWLACFMNLVAMYFLLNWLPTVIHNAGLTLHQSSMITGLFSTGGTLGALILSRMTDRFNPRHVLFLTFFGAAICVAMVGQGREVEMIMCSSFAAGFFVVGGQISFNAFVGRYYPARVRATGVGWALGVGRIGGILGPILGSVFLALALPTGSLFLLAAVPPTIAAIAIMFVRTQRPHVLDGTEMPTATVAP